MSISAALQTILDTNTFEPNIVLEIDGVSYASKSPDSGLVVDANKIGVINNVSINGLKVDLRSVQSSISSLNFNLLDKDERITIDFGTNTDIFQNVEVKFFFGAVNASLDFADYALLAVTRVSGMSKITNGYRFRSKEATALLRTAIFSTKSQLDGSITAGATTLTITDATDFPSSGKLKIDMEIMNYSGKAGNDLTGLTRGTDSSTADAHDDGTDTNLVFTVTDHAMDIALDLSKLK